MLEEGEEKLTVSDTTGIRRGKDVELVPVSESASLGKVAGWKVGSKGRVVDGLNVHEIENLVVVIEISGFAADSPQLGVPTFH